MRMHPDVLKELKMTQEEWDANCEAVWQRIRLDTIPQVDALMAAGWKFEFANPGSSTGTEPWQWYWRRPPRRKGSKGMLFLSTQMAFNHLMRSQGKNPYEAEVIKYASR